MAASDLQGTPCGLRTVLRGRVVCGNVSCFLDTVGLGSQLPHFLSQPLDVSHNVVVDLALHGSQDEVRNVLPLAHQYGSHHTSSLAEFVSLVTNRALRLVEVCARIVCP